MVSWGMSPKQFWRLSPIEFWWILEARNHGAPKSDLTTDDREELYELLEEMG